MFTSCIYSVGAAPAKTVKFVNASSGSIKSKSLRKTRHSSNDNTLCPEGHIVLFKLVFQIRVHELKLERSGSLFNADTSRSSSKCGEAELLLKYFLSISGRKTFRTRHELQEDIDRLDVRKVLNELEIT